jgi:hypothetical protein
MTKRRIRKAKKWAPRSEGIREARIHCRVPARIHDALSRAARRNGWTISAEVVHRLSESFAFPATPTQAIMTIVGYAIDSMAISAADKKTWLTDPVLHREARAAMEAAFNLLAPQSETVSAPEAGLHNGRVALEMWWDEVRRYNPKTPIDVTRPRRAEHQRRLTWLREALGSLPDRVVLWGKTGREVRRYSQALSLTEFKEFVDLARTRIEKKLTQEQLKRLQDLFNKAPPELRQKLKAPPEPGHRLNIWDDLSNPGPFGKIIPTKDKESES